MDKPGLFVGGGGSAQDTAQRLWLELANRHGLITGATGTGKTVTMQILAEEFSAAGVPVFMADVKGDVSGLSQAGAAKDFLFDRANRIGLPDFNLRAFPVVFWDLFGQAGHPVRTTISEIGPLLLAQMLNLTEVQEGVLTIAFAVADDQDLALLDLDDLRAMLVWLDENAPDVKARYGNVSSASIGAIQRALLVLENEGAAGFLGEPALDLADMMAVDSAGMGRINVLMADRLMSSPRLYAMFLLWLLSELFEALPEIGNPDKPVLVFFFDEAHLLFDTAPKALIDRIEQVVRLIRSKGVGVYFVTQNPDDVPPDVLGQLGNRIQHALRAFTPRDAKALRLAAETFRPNPDFDTETAIREVGTGEAVTSLLEGKAVPGIAQRTLIRPPGSRMGPLTEAERAAVIAASPLAGRYDTPVNRDSAHERLAERAKAAAADVARAEAATSEARDAFAEFNKARRYQPPKRSSAPERRGPSLSDTLARTVVKQLNSREGQKLVRGILGSLFRAR
ncbi:ATP-binding protein [Meridianimarinicoccus roseus]|uniref:ATP-binding protein n=1 Tax=Meridianimarinicoccus roseus TaxID=2072018 RepID=A0A2V2LCX9_9RHOB|nr:helicase HerA-like domain-containing protein [Meridianimarinicoccus roseus]PWR01126.1 ATP-binding protein [Meridianimarinicoccus roseus]